MRIGKSALIAGMFSIALFASACGSDEASSPASSSSKATSSSAQSTSAQPSEQSTEPADETTPSATHPASKAKGKKATPQPEQDDDPGGHPCTDQSGAPGHLTSSGSGWVCEITGDAPRADKQRHASHDDDPGGHPCTDQSGAPGHLISSDSGWVCEITGDAPRS